ncbi:class I SAM-dependent methyltransferase [Angustibacter peucedani]
MTSDARETWDAEAPTFDDEPDHGLRDPEVRAAWAELLAELLPSPPAHVADLGCGTGSLSVLLSSSGHHVRGVDVSPEMVTRARAKAAAAGAPATFQVGDASAPELESGAFDVVLSRHVVWALPDPRAALTRWTDLLAPGGRMVLVEGYWFTEAGLRADDLRALLDPRLVLREVRTLDDPRYWGKDITDERYVLVADVTA